MPPSNSPPPSPLPVVLAPGLLCDARLWAPVRDRLTAPSVGVEFGEAGSLDGMAQAILEAGPERFVLAGFSMGGMAAILAAAQAPGRVAALAILDTHAEVDTPERARVRLEQMAAAEAGGFATLVASLKPGYFAEPEAHLQERRLVADMAHAQGAERFARHVRAILERPDLSAVAATLRLPTHVVAGAEDALAPPAFAQRLAGLIPGAELTLLEGCGHLAPIERPDEVAAVIDALVLRASALAAADTQREPA